jgi:hypothetical protein
MAIASGGTLGTGASSTSSTNFTLTTATNILAAGDCALLVVSTDNSGTTDGNNNEHTSVTGGTGTWIKLGEWANANGAAGGGSTVSLWLFVASGSMATGTVITMNSSATITDKCASFWKFTVAAGATLRLSLDPTTNPSNNDTDGAVGFGSVSFSALASKARLYFRALAKEANSTTAITPSTNFTAITNTRSRNNALAQMVQGEFRINTSTGETSNPTLAITGDTAGLFAAIEEKTIVQVASTAKVHPRLKGTLNVRVPVSGTIKSRSTRLVSTGINLMQKATQIRVRPRLLGAALITIASLHSTTRVSERLKGQLHTNAGTTTALAGQIRSTSVLKSTGIILSQKSSPVKVAPRLKGALNVRVPVAGKIRTFERLKGSLGLASTNTNVVGQIRTLERLKGSLSSRVALGGGRIRVLECVRGSLTMGGGTPVSMAGTIKSRSARLISTGIILSQKSSPIRVHERLRGSLTIGGGTPVFMAGTIRSRSARLVSVGVILSQKSSSVRVAPRLKGALGFGTPKAQLAGVIRSRSARLLSELSTWRYSGPTISATPRLIGSLTMAGRTQVAGKIRVASVRLRGAVTTGTALRATTRVLERTRGSLNTRVAVRGTIRSAARDTGSLGTKIPLASKIRVLARNKGFAKAGTALRSQIVAIARVRGTMVSRVAFRTTIKALSRVKGAAMFLGGVQRVTPPTHVIIDPSVSHPTTVNLDDSTTSMTIE